MPVSLSETAYSCIKRMILSNRVKPGEPFDVGGTARLFSLGRTPVREALFRLSVEGLVFTENGRGFFVSRITTQYLKDLFETVLYMEKSALMIAYQRISPARLQDLDLIVRLQTQAFRQHDYITEAVFSSRFHATVYAAADNRFLVTHLNGLHQHLRRLAMICVDASPDREHIQAGFEQSIEDHRRLIECLENRRRDAILDLITRHLIGFLERVRTCGAKFVLIGSRPEEPFSRTTA